MDYPQSLESAKQMFVSQHNESQKIGDWMKEERG